MTIDEAAARAKVTKNTVIRWMDSGSLKAHRAIRKGLTRGITRIKLDELDALLEGATK
jgi:excisionase family DNA binding protein